MSEIKVNNIQSLSGTNGPEISGTVEMNSTGAMSLPRGDTTYRGGRGRGVFYGGNTGSLSNVVDFVTISTLGNAVDFGDALDGDPLKGSCASAIKGFFTGGYFSTSNNIDYITISSTGNGFDFGDCTVSTGRRTGFNSPTRGVFCAGGIDPATDFDTIEYFTMASTGNTSDFGNLTLARNRTGGSSSPTRGLCYGGLISGAGQIGTSTIDYVTIATTGDAQDFGDLTVVSTGSGGFATGNSTRGLYATKFVAPINYNNIEYITYASKGDTIDFGDTVETGRYGGGNSNATRATLATGMNPGNTNNICYVEISTLGDATDFGDLTVARNGFGTASDTNGGLG